MRSIVIRIGILALLFLSSVAFAKRAYNKFTAPFETTVSNNDLPPPVSAEPEVTDAALDLPKQISFSQTLARPAFFPGRKIPQPAAAPASPPQDNDVTPPPPAASATPASAFKLRGVAKTPHGWRALIQTENGETEWFESAQSIGAWSVLTIDENKVTLRSARGEATLSLYPPQSIN